MLDKKFIAYLISDIVISLLLTILLTDIITKSTDAMNLIASTFSILSGVVLMILTTVGELFLFSPNDSSAKKIAKYKNFETRFSRLSLLFISYLIILVLILIYYLIKDISQDVITFKISELTINLQNWTAYLIILFSFFCFIISICLPWIYKQLLKEKNGIYD